MKREQRKALRSELKAIKRWARVERAIVRQLVRVPRPVRGVVVQRAMDHANVLP